MKTIYNVYVPIESQEQADRMKKICIDYGLPYWYYKDAFEFYQNTYFFHNEWCGFSVDSYNGKPKKGYTQWHLNNAKEFVADEAVVCIPSHSHLHGAKLVDKQSIHTAIDNYIEINLNK